MNNQEILSILENNKEEYREIFLKEWKILSDQRVKIEGIDYRSNYLDEIDKEIDEELDSFISIDSKEKIDFKTLKDKIKEAISFSVWMVVCKFKDDNQKEGEPKKEVEDFFNSGELGATLIDQLIQQAFNAIGLVWVGFPSLISSAIGKAVVKWVNGRIAAKCDEIVEKKAKAFCKIPVKKPA